MRSENDVSDHTSTPGEALKAKLERAVLEVFSSEDFHRATMRTIARNSGVGLATIYRHFGSKEALLFFFVDEWLSGFFERMVDHLKGITDPKERVRKIFWLHLDYFERNPEVGRILILNIPFKRWMFKKWMAGKNFERNRLFDVFLDVIQDGQRAGVLNAAVAPGVLIDFIYGLVHRCFTSWVFDGQTPGLADQANVLFDLLWGGIANPDGAARLATS
jgi:AcrR family transcriptional regulator